MMTLRTPVTALAALGLACGDRAPSAPGLPELSGETFELRVGETALFEGGDLAVTFRSVLEDGRCPIDVDCVWAGNAAIELVVTVGGESTAVQLNTLVNPKAVELGVYDLTLVELEPLPHAGEPTPPELYVATLRFVRLPPDAFRIDGHVRFLNVEGGCWAIDAADGTRYEPVNLPAEFQVDGLPVRAALKPRPDRVSICMVGEIVEVLSIRRRIDAIA